MAIFLILLLLFVIVSVFGPRWIPSGLSWSNLAKKTVRYGAVAGLVFTALSTSFVHIDDGKVGHLFKVYGTQSLEGGDIIAAHGETGPQAEIFSPGFKFRFLLNIIYDVKELEEVIVEEGEYAFLTAKAGRPLDSDQTFADSLASLKTEGGELVDPYQMIVDVEYFLENGGQKGPQTTVLTPGRHRLNLYHWDYEILEARDVPKGFVAVIKSNVHSSVDFGALKTAKPMDCTPKSTRHSEELDVPLVPVGCIGIWDKALHHGLYYINEKAFDVSLVPIRVNAWQYVGGYESRIIDLSYDQSGEILQTPRKETVETPEGAADSAIPVKVEGWTIRQNARILVQIRPENAPFVVASTGGISEVEDRIITPAFQSVLRNIAGSSLYAPTPLLDEKGNPVLDPETGSVKTKEVLRPTRALDFIENRTLIEEQVEPLVQHEGGKAGVDIMEVRLLQPDFPPELLVARKREQLADQLRRAYEQEEIAQTARIETENRSATAAQQSNLVQAEIQFERAQRIAKAKREEGLGERDKLNLIAEGQKSQAKVLGEDRVVELRKFELVLDKSFQFFGEHPEVLTTALANAHKFVPERVFSMGSGNAGGVDSLMGAAGVLGDFMSPSSTPRPTQIPLQRPQTQEDQSVQ